ncbi:MAG: LemA family protein [Candidatus Nanoarchaeia archaeon]|nr:LemA family protein [Candidatus Nanoarchaeia archaeon]
MVSYLIWGIVIAVFVIVAVFAYYFNRIVILGNRADNAWSQIDVQLKKRADLVPNLIETVKGYMKHEKGVFEAVTAARSSWMGAKTNAEKAKAGNELAGALKSILAVSENYPQLKANENFNILMEELSGIENKIAYARQFYNDSILGYNNTVTTFPGMFFAGLFGKKEKEFLEIAPAERENVKVQF